MSTAPCGYEEDGLACETRPAFTLDLPVGRLPVCTDHLAPAIQSAFDNELPRVLVSKYAPPKYGLAERGDRSRAPSEVPVGGTKRPRQSSLGAASAALHLRRLPPRARA